MCTSESSSTFLPNTNPTLTTSKHRLPMCLCRPRASNARSGLWIRQPCRVRLEVLRRHLFDHADQPPVLGLGVRPAFHDFDGVSHMRGVLLIMNMADGP